MIPASISHYEVIEQIGSGGMGKVYLARDTRLKRQVALKVLPDAFVRDPDRMRRFEQEAEAASALNHPNILTVHEIGEASGVHFIATEFIDGDSLRTRMAPGSLELSEIVDLVIQIASALTAAHRAGIVHRDIKPENVMVRRDGYVKVVDFGLAKLSGNAGPLDRDPATRTAVMTEPGVVLGTRNYMSPEQARGKPLDARTDIWSLGVVLYEMVARRLPFTGESSADVIASIVTADPPPVSQYVRGVPEELWRIIAKALEKDRDDRYQHANEMEVDLRRLRRDLDAPGRSRYPGSVPAGAMRSRLWWPAIAAALAGIALAAWTVLKDDESGSIARTALEGTVATAPTADGVTVQFRASPTTVRPNEPVVLTWDVTGASNVVIEGLGTVSDSGQRTVFPSRTSVYWLTAWRGDAKKTASVQVVVSAPAGNPAQDTERVLNALREAQSSGRGTQAPGSPGAIPTRPVSTPPTDGRIVWNGKLAPGESLTISGNRASIGEFAGALPQAATIVDIVPAAVKPLKRSGNEVVLQNTAETTQTLIIIRWSLPK